jgi:hypothetical protein
MARTKKNYPEKEKQEEGTEFDARAIIEHKEDVGLTWYLIDWKPCAVSRRWLQKWYPEVLERWDKKKTTQADQGEVVQKQSNGRRTAQADQVDEVIRKQSNGQLMCQWRPSWSTSVSPALLAKYKERIGAEPKSRRATTEEVSPSTDDMKKKGNKDQSTKKIKKDDEDDESDEDGEDEDEEDGEEGDVEDESKEGKTEAKEATQENKSTGSPSMTASPEQNDKPVPPPQKSAPATKARQTARMSTAPQPQPKRRALSSHQPKRPRA